MDERQLKICMLISGQFPSVGGAEITTYELCQALSKKGCEISVACSAEGVNQTKEVKDIPNVKTYPILKISKKEVIKSAFSLFRVFRRERFDLINAHFAFPVGTIGLIAKLLRVPLLITAHGGDIQKNEEVDYGIRQNRLLASALWLTLKFVDHLIVPSNSVVKDAIDAGCPASKISVVYNGFDFDKISSLGESDILSKHQITKDDFIILYLGRLHPKKCPQDLLKAFLRVSQVVPNAKLVFAGDGGERERLERLSEDLALRSKVIFTGFVTSDDKWGLIKNCHVFVLPSLVESFGRTIVEAMCCQKPVIATNSGPFPEIIDDGETGLLVPVHSPDELANAVIRLASDEEKRKEMGIKARQAVYNRFSIDKIAKDYYEVCKKVAQKGK